MADGDARAGSVEEVADKYGLEMNPTDQDTSGEEEAASAPEGGTSREPDLSAADRELEERMMFEGLDDNLEILEEREKQATAADEVEAGGEDEAEAEPPEDAEPEAQAEEADEAAEEPEGDEDADEEGEEREEDVGYDSWREWLTNEIDDPSDRQALFDSLLESEDIVLRYTANGEEHEESAQEVLRKAAGYMGQGEVTKRFQEAAQRQQQVEQLREQLVEQAQKIQTVQERLQSTIDDPATFTDTLSSMASLDYLKDLRDNLDMVVREAEENPRLFRVDRRLSGIERGLQAMMGGIQNGEAASREPPASRNGAETQNTDSGIPEDLGFQPGVGYPGDYAEIAVRDVRNMLAGADTDLTFDDVADRWEEEGMTRPVHEVTRDLLKAERGDSRKRNIAADPPTRGRQPRRKPGSGEASNESEKQPSSREPETWDDIEKHVRSMIEGG